MDMIFLCQESTGVLFTIQPARGFFPQSCLVQRCLEAFGSGFTNGGDINCTPGNYSVLRQMRSF